MQDVLDIIKNIESIYDSNTSFQVLKDFERVLDDLDLYVYLNWGKGELAKGPIITRHWVTCTFMWKRNEMPDPMGGKRLLDYDCKVRYQKTSLMQPRKIRKPSDMRPGTKKGKMDLEPIWLVEIQMPKKLISDIYSGYLNDVMDQEEQFNVSKESQPEDELASGTNDNVEGNLGGAEVDDNMSGDNTGL